MGITNLFRPKYRHSDAAVRAEAVRELDSDEVDTLVVVARDDADASVRRIAIEKIDDAGRLVEIAGVEEELKLIDLQRLHVAGDGSKLPTWASSRGKKLCKCDNRHKKAQDRCRCYRK